MSRIVGIDLGTTNCCVAIVDGDKPRVIPNKHGYNTTPSVLAVQEDGDRVVGQIAVRQAITNAQNTVYGIKRLMGRPYDSEEVEHAQAHCSFQITPGPSGDARITLMGKEYSVAELSAMFLQEMRVVAEDFTNDEVDRAVVTVPAYFNDNQRQAVRDAGRVAGLDVVRILNEPTAAALAYGFGEEPARTLAVYDLGGGTFDISIVYIDEAGEFHVIATTGDSYLGGEDFDERMMDFVLAAFHRDHELDLRESPMAITRLRQAVQKAKADLSAVREVEISLPFIIQNESGPLNLEYSITREQLEQITADLVTRTLQICEVGLRYAEMQPEQVDEVVLVGGMTRMPAIQRAVEEYFGRPPCKGVHPDEVVALGAAILGHAIETESEEVALHDVTAHSLGIMTAGGGFDALIPANTPVPTFMQEVFSTSRDGQTTVKIVVLQGESPKAAENTALGRFALTGLREATAGHVQVQVTFSIDDDGIFSVGAKDLETGEEKVIDVLASSGLTDEEVDRMMADSTEYIAYRRAQENPDGNRHACLELIERLNAMLPEAEKNLAWTPVGANAVENARKAVQLVEARLDESDTEATAKHIAMLARVEVMLAKAMTKAAS